MKKTPDHKKLMAMENGLVPIFAKLSKMEKRFLAYCIAQLNPMQETKLGLLKVNIGDIAKVFDLATTHTYPIMKEAATSINSHPIFRIEGKAHKMDFWFYHLDWLPESGQIEIQFSERLTPLLLDLKEKGYVQHTLGMAKGFTNKGWTLYVILKQWIKTGTQDFELDELKALMGISGKYKKWYEFSRLIIVPATENINKVSDLKVSYVKMKRGRTVAGVSFTISRNKLNSPQADIDVEDPEKRIYAILTMGGLHSKTIKRFIETARKHDRLHEFMEKAEKLLEKHSKKGPGKAKAITGSLNLFVQGWGQLSLFDLPTEKAAPRTIDSDAIRKCMAEKRGCEIRKTGQPRREMCIDCLELYPEHQ